MHKGAQVGHLLLCRKHKQKHRDKNLNSTLQKYKDKLGDRLLKKEFVCLFLSEMLVL